MLIGIEATSAIHQNINVEYYQIGEGQFLECSPGYGRNLNRLSNLEQLKSTNEVI